MWRSCLYRVYTERSYWISDGGNAKKRTSVRVPLEFTCENCFEPRSDGPGIRRALENPRSWYIFMTYSTHTSHILLFPIVIFNILQTYLYFISTLYIFHTRCYEHVCRFAHTRHTQDGGYSRQKGSQNLRWWHYTPVEFGLNCKSTGTEQTLSSRRVSKTKKSTWTARVWRKARGSWSTMRVTSMAASK